MCTYFETLASVNTFRQIAQCEHGTIHLSWDFVTVYLSEAELTRVAMLIERGHTPTESSAWQAEHSRLFYCARQRQHQLWLRNLALTLSPADFEHLRTLLAAAQQAIAQPPAQKLDPQTRRALHTFHRQKYVSPSVKFSGN